eukprot:10255941-Lingulodinium_polyedra.AAC.1
MSSQTARGSVASSSPSFRPLGSIGSVAGSSPLSGPAHSGAVVSRGSPAVRVAAVMRRPALCQ